MPKLLLLFLILSLVGVGWLGLRQYQLHQQVLGLATIQDQQNRILHQQITYWELVASASPTYRDSYVQLAVLNNQLGNTEAAKGWVKKILEIDPNWIAPTPLSSLLP